MSTIPYAATLETPGSNLLHDKVAIITGGSDGIGKATALDFAKEGAKLVIFGRTKTKVDETVNDINKQFGFHTAVGYTGDASKESDNKAVVDLALDTYKRLDIAFNNAGIYTGNIPVHETEEKLFDDIFSVNVKGVLWALKFQIPAMLATADGKGSIIVNSSLLGSRTSKNISVGGAVYNASKAAITSIAKTAAIEQAEKIRINVLEPGLIHTNILDGKLTRDQVVGWGKGIALAGRTGTPQELSGIVSFLASDRASFITGASFLVDGGASLV